MDVENTTAACFPKTNSLGAAANQALAVGREY
jgi:hypothetical protein